MKFNIIEGNSSRLSEEEYNSFVEDYLESNLTSNEVRLKYNLSTKEYAQLTKKIREQQGISSRPYPNCRYFYKQHNRWQIIKTVNHQRLCFGSLPVSEFSEEDMEEIINTLKEMEWDFVLCEQYITELNSRVT